MRNEIFEIYDLSVDQQQEFDVLAEQYLGLINTNPLQHYPAFWQHIVEKLLHRNLGYDEIERIYDIYLDQYQDNIQIFEDFETLILGLKDTVIKKGIIANGNAKRIYRFLTKYALLDDFDTVVASGATAFKKPDTSIFRLALLNLGSSPINSVFVGDRLDTDVLGANASGLWSVLIRRNNKRENSSSSAPSVIPDFCVTSLEEIPKLSIFQMQADIDSVVIPCGGRGSRMNELTESNQKCLLEVNGKPLLMRIVEKFKNCGVKNFYFITKYLTEQVEACFQDGSELDINVTYLGNDRHSTAYGIYSNLDKLPDKFLYSHGNILVDNALISKLLKRAYLNPNIPSFVLTRNEIAKTHPVFEFHNEELVGIFRHKGAESNNEFLYSVGLSYINKNCIQKLPDNSFDIDFTAEQLFHNQGVDSFEYNDNWLHLESKADLDLFRTQIDNEQFR
ncbi:MAG: HAD-IA family hydrolase [Pyrinomonadaceae bacterium]